MNTHVRAMSALALAAACLVPSAAHAEDVTVTEPFVLWRESYNLGVTYLTFGLTHGCAANGTDDLTPGAYVCVTPPADAASVDIRLEQAVGGELLAVAGKAGTNYYPGPREDFCGASSTLALNPEVSNNPKLVVTVYGPGLGPGLCGIDPARPSVGVGIAGRIVMTFHR